MKRFALLALGLLLILATAADALQPAVRRMVGRQYVSGVQGSGILHVQDATKSRSSTAVTSITIGGAGWASNNTSGNRIIVITCLYTGDLNGLDAGATHATVTDDKSGGSNTYVLDASFETSPFWVGIWSTNSTATGQKLTITVGFMGASAVSTVFAGEFSGIATSSYSDGVIEDQSGSTAPTMTLGLATNNSMSVGAILVDAPGAETVTPAAGFSTIGEEEDGTTYLVGSSIYQLFDTSGDKTINWTAPTIRDWKGCSVGYKKAP